MANILLFFCVLGGALALDTEMAESLPEVEEVLSKASDTAQDFSAKAAAMQALVSKKQEESRVALANQKDAYERNLTALTAEIHAVKSQNMKLEASVDDVTKQNVEIKRETERLRGENNIIRNTLTSLGVKVDAAEQFLDDSLLRTDDAGADALKPLLPPVPEPSLSNFLSVMGDAHQKDAKTSASLLQLASHIHHKRSRTTRSKVMEQSNIGESSEDVNPDLLDRLLSNSLADIQTEQLEAEAEMKAHFLSIHNASIKQLAQVNETHESLKQKLAETKMLRDSLLAAKTHVLSTRAELIKRMHGMEVFAKKVDDAAANALVSVEATLSSLSEPQSTPAKVKAAHSGQIFLQGSKRNATQQSAK